MAAPDVQIYENGSKIRLMWELDRTGVYQAFNLYWAVPSSMAGEVLLRSKINNAANAFESNKHVFVDFNRTEIGLTEAAEFHVRIKGIQMSGVEDAANPSATKFIPAANESPEEYHVAMTYGFDNTNGIWRRITVNADGSMANAPATKSTLSILNATVDGTAQTSSVVACAGFGQADIYLNYTKGTETNLSVTVQFSPDNVNWYDQVYELVSGGIITTLPKTLVYTTSVTHRLAVPLDDNYMRLLVQSSGGVPTGTVTASLTLGWN